MNISEYIRELNAQLKGGRATEHSHRPALKTLLEAAVPDALATNEPRQIDCGAPDFVLTRKSGIPLGYVEAKNIGKDLDDKTYRAQFKRYAGALDNLIITDYLEFRLFLDGKHVETARIGDLRGKVVKARPDGAGELENLFRFFAGHTGIAVTGADALAEHMAAKARMLAQTIAKALDQDEALPETSEKLRGALHGQLAAFREHLIHDIKPAEFADIYAQTIAYGMFAARLHDETPGEFTREKAAWLIPAANPFLRKFFQQIAAFDLDERIRWVVDALADLFRVSAVEELMAEYGKATRRNDPFLHFYETFLGAYDRKLRKSRGVYYTPQPVVDFIVRAVDEILRDEFKLENGIANAGKAANGMHKVQILDPATGTGTFLAAIIRHIHDAYFQGQQGAWQNYATADLLPRLNGFEILMAPYAMAHIKLDMVLRETGCQLGDERARVFLTNALEEHHPDTGTLFSQWLANEADEANRIKRDVPVMVVTGNPPYAGESANKGEWIANLLDAYKKEPGGKEKLKERNSKPLNDDYVKFVRCGQHHIDNKGEGILAYICNNSFLDNQTFRGMRWNLLKSFDKIFVVDLHGDAKKEETAPDGSKDVNVFDIRPGVSINLFVKTGRKKAGELARVFHLDLLGKRENKYQFLLENDLAKVKFAELSPAAPSFFFVPKNYELQAEYEKGFSVAEIFPTYSAGIATSRDAFTIHATMEELQKTMSKFRKLDDETARVELSLGADAQDWKISLARKDLEENVFGNKNNPPVPISYRPFDTQYTYYTGKSKGFHSRPRGKLMHHFFAGKNFGLISTKRVRSGEWASIFVTDKISNGATSLSSLDKNFVFPLYLYPETAQEDLDEKSARKPNLDPKIVEKITGALNLRFTPEKEDDSKTFAPIDLLDYIYAVLHSRFYRKRFNEFLKVDFPRVPFPADTDSFAMLKRIGGKLREVHLLEGLSTITKYPESGDNAITERITAKSFAVTDAKAKTGRVRINANQYFDGVPETAWNFHIGGYQPAQKWLKDRQAKNWITPTSPTGKKSSPRWRRRRN